jgi:cyclopropane fatty-acyl-phospholipid synthase-like methyltransferase
MKARESGMPEEAYWESFFDADATMELLFNASGLSGHLVEFGCGYGTFTVPAVQRTHGVVTALDIEPLMVERVRQRAETLGLSNVRAEIRDFVAQGSGLESGTQDVPI